MDRNCFAAWTTTQTNREKSQFLNFLQFQFKIKFKAFFVRNFSFFNRIRGVSWKWKPQIWIKAFNSFMEKDTVFILNGQSDVIDHKLTQFLVCVPLFRPSEGMIFGVLIFFFVCWSELTTKRFWYAVGVYVSNEAHLISRKSSNCTNRPTSMCMRPSKTTREI